jgi:hypothetical protein
MEEKGPPLKVAQFPPLLLFRSFSIHLRVSLLLEVLIQRRPADKAAPSYPVPTPQRDRAYRILSQ